MQLLDEIIIKETATSMRLQTLETLPARYRDTTILSLLLFDLRGWPDQRGLPQQQASAQTPSNDITYIYDELGRLTGVVDPAADTAKYTYDAVGNLLSISRYSSSLVSIIEFTPNGGPVGTSVAIYGTGFSTTASQNTVTFNGVPASVTSATATQIVAGLPSGATTGPISITTPTGSATSSTPFTVTASTGAPTITGFSPTVGVSGTLVTIAGTNFETNLLNNRVIANRQYIVEI